jgi:SAM-dependent methyltransferase/methyltransferase-like protein
VPASNPYDEVPYTSTVRPQTHPDRLATLATLFGMRPTAIEACRVLELGCNDGANLIPMAYALPGSAFVGVDLAAQPLALGRATIARLGLTNVQLLQRDVMDGADDLGRFDYIIAHGLYSWVPAPVRERLLATAQACLTANGVFYVSFNAHPGGHFRNLARELMLVHTGGIDDPADKVRRGLEIVQFVATSKPEADLYRMVLAKELERLTTAGFEAVFHDDLAAVNESVAFAGFMADARRAGLRYLADADPTELKPKGFAPEVLAAIDGFAAGDRIRREQYTDLLTCRRFRQTLLCRDGVAIADVPDPTQVDRLLATTWLRPIDVGEGPATEWRFEDGKAVVTAGHPVAATALRVLAESWPVSLGFAALLERVRAAGPLGTYDHPEQRLREMLLQLYVNQLVELHTYVAAARPGERPLASALARLQLEDGTTVTSLLHRTVALEDTAIRDLVRALDGSRDRAALIAELGLTAAELEQGLDGLGRYGLLVDRGTAEKP